MVKIKRIYEQPSKEDGFRVLIDRLWPRGISKEKAQIDLWYKDIAPSNELRKWFAHDPAKWDEFQKKYKAEVSLQKDKLDELKELIKKKDTVTLLYSASDREHNNAVVLMEVLTHD